MESNHLYRVERSDLPRLQKLLVECFASDPLYHTLIPDADTRKRLMPKLFACDLDEMYETCEIFADSPALNGLLVVSDEAEPYDPLHFYLTELVANLKTDEYVMQEDWSLKTLWNFIRGRDYLNSRWTDQLHQENRLHIIYLAVSPAARHHGIAERLMDECIDYAQKHHMMISLETHNEHNVPLYEHFGFKVFGIVDKGMGLKQYCLIREFQ